MHSNNETGTQQPITDISQITREHGILLHTDAAQSAGKVPLNVDQLGVDLLTVVGHKMYAPKGIAALYIREGVTLEPLIGGGGQERGMRAGTENVALVTALGAAADLAVHALDTGETTRLTTLPDRLGSRRPARWQRPLQLPPWLRSQSRAHENRGCLTRRLATHSRSRVSRGGRSLFPSGEGLVPRRPRPEKGSADPLDRPRSYRDDLRKRAACRTRTDDLFNVRSASRRCPSGPMFGPDLALFGSYPSRSAPPHPAETSRIL